MSHKRILYGICRLCGENKKLTFEHVPSETVFNKGAVRQSDDESNGYVYVASGF